MINLNIPIIFLGLLLTACADPAGPTIKTCPAGQTLDSASSACINITPPPQAPTSAEKALIRFVAIGDQGAGNETQRQVGAAMGRICLSLGGCDFGLLLGDNIYESGISSVDDPRWVSHFEVPYGALKFPFYAVLGNHDLGMAAWVDLDQDKAGYQIDYSQKNRQWKMPARYYDFSAGPVHFVALDTNPILFGRDAEQRRAVGEMLGAPDTRWTVAFGHHPYLSNGPHGNAGKYSFFPFFDGEAFRSFMDDEICGKVDFYLSGHDHSRQDLIPTCQGTQFIVSGAGATTTTLEGESPTHYQSDAVGFLLIEVTDTRFTIRFYDRKGTLDHERIVER